MQADAAYTSQLQLHKARIEGDGTKVLSAIEIPSRDRTLITVQFPEIHGGSGSYMLPRDFSRLTDPTWHEEELKWSNSVNRLMAFKAPVTSTSVWPREDPRIMFQVANCHGYSCYVGHVAEDEPFSTCFNTFNSRTGILDLSEQTLWDTAIDPTGSSTAVATGTGIQAQSIVEDFMSSPEGLGGDRKTEDCRALDWLTSDTIVAGDRKDVILWDLRTDWFLQMKGGGIAKRFTNESVVTGLQTVPNSGGNQILTSTNSHLNLYDLRMPSTHKDRTLLSIPNASEVPKLNFDISNRGIVATSTKRGPSTELRLVSLKTGQELRTLKSPKLSPFQPTQIMWFPDERGVDYLSVCAGSWVYKWTWQELDGEIKEG